MSTVGYVEVVFLILVVGAGLGGFIWAAMKDD